MTRFKYMPDGEGRGAAHQESKVAMIDKVGIIGAGAMGNGIAHVCALAKLDVKLIDVSEDQLKKAVETIRFNMERQVKRNLITADDEKAALARIKTGLKLDDLGDCDMVIEAATEKEAVKKDILKTLVPVLKPSALIASNTSSISITRLAAVTDRPADEVHRHALHEPGAGDAVGRADPRPGHR
jgi:3-hydroxybutyryl-CoA dehydrogenase